MVVMMNENIKSDRSLDQLGLPPMELAESSNERSSRCLYRCIYQTLQKLFILLVLITFSAGLYILLLKILETTENFHNTEIILVTGLRETRNITLQKNEWEIFFQLKNQTEANMKRRKRSVPHTHDKNREVFKHLKGGDLEKVREIILKHRSLCLDGKHIDSCSELITKFNAIIDRNKPVVMEDKKTPKVIDTTKDIEIEVDHNVLPSDVLKRDAHSLNRIRNVLSPASVGHLDSHLAQHSLPPRHPHFGGTPHLTDTCLLAKLLKRNCPQAHDIYDPLNHEAVMPHIDQPFTPHMRYFQPPPSYTQSREIETQLPKLHPQDLNIFMNFFTKPKHLQKQEEKKSSRAMECPSGYLLCDNNEDCVDEKQWCDGNVDCPDASDEIRCSCISRVDKSRLCDGYFDCPFGEDEMGCFGCSGNTFSCENSQSSCFTKEQRCNGVNDCLNHKDEIECNMLAPTLHDKPLFAISNTEGYLHRNFKGDWYAVCENPYMWAHDACRRETGLIIRPPFIQIVPIDPVTKVDYLNTGPEGVIQTSDTCFNSSAVYVTCPDFLCGTRVQTTSQLLREKMANENHLFGRNKRFLYPAFDPYRMMYFGNRMKRDTTATSSSESSSEDSGIETDSPNDNRKKRTEGRVVGGKPSQPAAWPWMVAIYRNGMFHCGGVILKQNWIISAAHCVHEFWDHYYEVQVGMLRRFSFSPQEQNHLVTHVIVNQHYNNIDMKDDLSLLKVEPAIQFSRWVRPICMPGPNTAGQDWLWGPAPGTICTAVGWGATIEHGPDPDHMREVEVPIWEHCKHLEDRAGKEICAGLVEGGKDACQGDSGGPLMCRNPLNSQQWYLAGIVSHGDGCARKDEPGVYTRVSLFVKWIKYHTSSKSLPSVKPRQVCPGFKCQSGISKCLPNIRKCDKIVDCLDAEDETNCAFMRSSVDFISKNVNKASEKKSKKTSREVELEPFSRRNKTTLNSEKNNVKPTETTLFTTEKKFDATIHFNDETTKSNTNTVTEQSEKEIVTDKSSAHITLSATEKQLAITTNIKPQESDSQSSKNKMSMVIVNETPDFEHASTIETSPSISSEDDSENVTFDPIMITSEEKIKTSSQRDLETITVSFKSGGLESRPFVTEISTISGENFTKDKTIKNNFDEKLKIDQSTQPPTLKPKTDDKQNINATPKIRGDDVPDEETKTENSLLNNSVTDNVAQSSATVNTSDKLVIELFPQSNSSQIDDTNTKKEEINLGDAETTGNNINGDILSAKKLPDIEESSVIQKIEDTVFSELQPASIRRKNRIPKQFECRRISQFIPFTRRCDRKADCEDGTDELDCTCTDYLSAFDEKLICDGVYDCADGQDEMDCSSCPESYFLCKQSEICLPTRYVCDGKAQCPLGEDELNCFALSNGKEMFYEIDGKPKINLEGFLTKRKKDDWQVVCDDKLSIEQQEESATHICRYLGFSSANRYFVKYINVKDEDIIRSGLDELRRSKRNTRGGVPVHFAFTDARIGDEIARNIIIKEPQVLKEECVPNVTKTCKSLYVFCDRSLYTNFEIGQDLLYNRAVEPHKKVTTSHLWPWIAKIYVDGDYKCTGILVDLAWVLVGDSCLWDSSPTNNFVSVILGSHRTLNSVKGWYEQVRKVDAKKDLYKSRVILLHLQEPVQYSNLVKPMIISSPNYHTNQKIICLSTGQDNNNKTISVFLNETSNHCKLGYRCFERHGIEGICPAGMESHRQWSGLISCHNEHGWYPAASFVESRGECGLGDHIVGTDIENLRHEIKYYTGKVLISDSIEHTGNDICQGVRCGRGKCVPLRQMCDGVKNCEDGEDESDKSCERKRDTCVNDPFINGCECSSDQMKCSNGKCIPKVLFRDGKDDCEDGTDEPVKTKCSDYLARVMPSKLCDGMLHCQDRSDEDPMYCRCFAKNAHMCGQSSETENCVALDMVCDGVRDCPNGDDERTCIGLSAPEGTPYGTGQVIVRSHGVWHSKCYPTQNHTKSELEAICRELGFLSGHAKEIKDRKYFVNSYNNLLLEPFNDVVLNNQTVIKMRNTNAPVARAVVDEDLKNCFPVFIECL